MKKLNQIFSLLACCLMMMAVAIQRDGKIVGHDLTEKPTETVSKTDSIYTESDGTIVVNTTSLGQKITGYGGAVPLEIRVKNNKIVKVTALANTETPEFFEEASALLEAWNGATVDEALKKEVDAVSGATMSSNAIIGNMRVGLETLQASGETGGTQFAGLQNLLKSPKLLIGLLVVLMAAILPLFIKSKRYHIIQLLLNVIVLGFWCGSFISYSLMVNFLSNGINVWASLIAIVMLVCAFIYPLFGKKSYYCQHICPFGSMQELAGKCTKKKWKLGATTVKWLDRFRLLLWAVLMFCMWSGVFFAWMDYEPFIAFIFQSASWIVIAIAALFILLSFFVTRPYCRFVCPTGTLFKLSQSSK